MSSAQRWKITIAAMLVASCVATSRAQDPAKTELNAVRLEMLKQYRSMDARLASRPSKVDVSKWDSILAGAKEIGAKVRQLKQLRSDLLSMTKEQGNSNGVFRSALHQLKNIFQELEKESRQDIDGTNGAPALPASLLEPTKREADMYHAMAECCDKLAAYASSVFARHKEAVAMLDRCGPMLDRLQRASENYVSLAQVGKQIEEGAKGLSVFSDQLNGVLDLFAGLNEQTKQAVTLLDDQPTPAPRATAPDSARSIGVQDRVGTSAAQTRITPASELPAPSSPTVEGLMTRMDQLERRQSAVVWNRQ